MEPSFDLDALAAIGLGERQRRQLQSGVADPAARPMRVVEVQRNHLRLHDGRGQHRARCDPLLAAELRAQEEALAVGDWVLARPVDAARPAAPPAADPTGPGWRVVHRLPPGGQITRRTTDGRAADGRPGAQRQVLASNVDLALLVMGLDGDFNPRRLERYLALARLAGVAAVVVLSKADAQPPAAVAQRLAEARSLLPPGAPLLALDLRQPAAARALAPWLPAGCTAVLLGSSGAGKSTLANTLLADRPDAGAAPPAGAAASHDGVVDAPAPSGRRTGAVRADDSRGRHTTTVRTLLPLPGGACLIDAPGLRALRLDLDRPEALAEAFGDVAALAPHCRFRDCRHGSEPGCAVRAALSPQRLRHYHQLLREAGAAVPAAATGAGAAGQAWAAAQAYRAAQAERKARHRAAQQRRRIAQGLDGPLPGRGASG